METIQMYNPKIEYQNHKADIDNSISTVLNHGLFINGPEVKTLQKKLENLTGAKHCIVVSNGTDALKIALLALDVGINDEVITVAHTWISTAEVISLINAKPVFVDIKEDTFNIDPLKLEEKINKNTKAIIVVSLYGQPCDMNEINEIANRYNLPVIEDGAQSFGSKYKNKFSCNLSTIGTTSFFPSKPLGCYGDGGACFTNNDALATKMTAIKNHGGVKRFHHDYIGLNARLDTIQAAILNVKLEYFDDTVKNRNSCANYYNNKLQQLEVEGYIKLPKICDDRTSVWAQYSLLAKNKEVRDSIVSYLKENNINVSIFYPVPLYKQKCFENLQYCSDDLPVTEKVCNTIFNLPCYGELKREDQEYIISKVINFFN